MNTIYWITLIVISFIVGMTIGFECGKSYLATLVKKLSDINDKFKK